MQRLQQLLEAAKMVNWNFDRSSGFIKAWGPGTFQIKDDLKLAGFKFVNKVWEAKMTVSTFLSLAGELEKKNNVKFQKG